MPPLPHDDDDGASRLEAGRSQDLGEKSSSDRIYNNSRLQFPRTESSRAHTERMPSAGRLLLTLLLAFLVTFGLANALSPVEWHRRPYRQGDVVRHGEEGKAEDTQSLTSIIEAASPSSLHDLLHKYFPERFKDGVWESDVSAVEAVRRVDAALAASIVQLAKRQDNGTTTTTHTTTPPPESSTTTSRSVTTPPPDDESSTTTETSSTAPPPTTTTPTSSTPGPSSTSSTGRSSSTNGPSSSSSRTTTTTKGPTTSPGTSNSITSRPTSTSFTTSRPVTSTFTSTKDDGGVVVVTTTSWVNAAPAETGPTSTRPSPTLQNAAPGRQNHARGVLFGAVVVGAALLI
ncbi:hypothetical protein NKR19_g2449 [Coniochaeta hoffmannii]|uniref:Uncharacterized protein n=1 Tax=Coniochaeta hoffmannii TaxID=91930 RepID=A0AA38VZT3_9PEZI|nr:hypothetical protein NKR19_g2449 [Coniochaeta hoffmannii]